MPIFILFVAAMFIYCGNLLWQSGLTLFARYNSHTTSLHAADLPRLFQRPPGNSRVAWLLLDSKVIQRVEIAEIPEKRAFRGIPIQFYHIPRPTVKHIQ